MDYYISLAGDDANIGSVSSPFNTIGKGLNSAQAGDRVIIREGIYRGNVGWFPGNATGNFPISIEAFSGEPVTISALSLLSGWEPVDLTNGKAIYRAPMLFTMCGSSSAIAGEDFLVCNGKVLNEAQWPAAQINKYPQLSEGWASVDSGSWTTDTSLASVTGTIQDADLSNFATNSLIGSCITILTGARWTLLSGQVTANQGTTLTFTCKSPGGESFYKPDDRSLYFLFGKQAFLSYPGSWWRDSDSNYVYVWLPDGSDPNNSIIEAKKDDKLFDFWSRSFYQFKNIDFIGATVHTPNVSDFSFIGCSFKHYNHRLYFANIWSWFKPGIFVTGNNYRITDCDFSDAIGPAITADNQSNLTIENCTILNCMQVDFAGVNSTFTQNTVGDSPGPCVRLYKNCTGSQIKNNDLGASGKMYTDEGVLLISKGCIGGGTKVSFNFIHDGMAPVDKDEFYGSSGIYFDSETSGMTFDHNIVVRTTSPSVSLVCGNGIDSMSFYSNTFDSDSGIYWIPQSWGGRLTGCKFINNYARKRGDNTKFHPDVEYSCNAFKESPSDESLPPNNLLTPNPKFNNDYSLQSDSPLRNAGIPVVNITSMQVPDIGAWEGGRTVIGAIVRQKDLSRLLLTATRIDLSVNLTISNLPLGRKIGDSFGIKIGNTIATRSGDNGFIFQGVSSGDFIFARATSDESWIQIGQLTLTEPPLITGISPTSGTSGTQVTVTGSGFSVGAKVSIDSLQVDAQVVNSNTLTLLIP